MYKYTYQYVYIPVCIKQPHVLLLSTKPSRNLDSYVFVSFFPTSRMGKKRKHQPTTEGKPKPTSSQHDQATKQQQHKGNKKNKPTGEKGEGQGQGAGGFKIPKADGGQPRPGGR